MRSLLNLLSRFCIPLILLACTWMISNIKWGKDQLKYTVISDGKGYYAYLPATFIYHDLNLGFFDTIEAKYYDDHTKYDYRSGANGKVIDKYFAGVAVMQAPFFLAGHALTLMSDEPADGYSKWYMILFCIGALFWLAAGLYYLRRFLRLHGASDLQSAFILCLICFGTNLFYYTVAEPAMSHLYSFALVSMFLYFGKRWIQDARPAAAIKCALLLGMIFFVRPVNVLVALWLVFEAGGFAILWQRISSLFRSPRVLAACVVLLIVPFFVQMMIWKIQTGSWFVNSYGKEAFHFGQPHLLDFLFSYRKGMFVYVPLLFIALFGFIPLWKKDRTRAVIALLFLLFITYVLSCWWMWYYGGSFGSRVMIEFLPVFAMLLVYLLNGIKNRLVHLAVIGLLGVVMLFCQFQTHQYRYNMIHWSDMDKEKYWTVFGKLP